MVSLDQKIVFFWVHPPIITAQLNLLTAEACNCIPKKQGNYGSCPVIVCVRRDFPVFNLQVTFVFGFLLNFASGLLWQRSGHSIVFVAQESKLCSGESKMSKILTFVCVQAVGHSFFQIYFIFSA